MSYLALERGLRAPDFEGIDQHGNNFHLYDFVGKKNIVLYFYPKDFTLGCTKEAIGFLRYLEHIINLDAIIVGVSTDSVESHKKFSDKYGIKYPLIADPDGEIARKYDVLQITKTGRKRALRTTYLIDKNGIIQYVWKRIKVDRHPLEVLEKLELLN